MVLVVIAVVQHVGINATVPAVLVVLVAERAVLVVDIAVGVHVIKHAKVVLDVLAALHVLTIVQVAAEEPVLL